jgi:preprotein translocase subunit SecD
MYKNLRWKVITILAVLLIFGSLGLYPIIASRYGVKSPAWLMAYQLRLGLDLKGGLQLILQVQTNDAIKVEVESSAEQLRNALKDANVPVTAVQTDPAQAQFTIEGIPGPSESQFRTIADNQTGQSYDRDARGAGTHVFTMKPNILKQRREETVAQAIQTLERRVNELGVAEPWVGPYGSAGDQIMVELPGLKDPARAKEIMGKTAMLELKLVEAGPLPDEASLLQAQGGKLPADMETVRGVAATPGDTARPYYLVKKTAIINGNDLRNAKPTIDQYNQPAVSFTLSNEGSAKFGAATAANIGRQLAIILDDQIESAPVIQSAISREGQITGTFTAQEASDLALVLRSGALPASLTYQRSQEVGPTLGADSVKAGVMASIMGLTAVTLFMLMYYRLAGINAFVSIVMNLVILLGFMAYVGAVMTLPGIAGFILTIGMGVDSNVLIFERIREELATKKGIRQAVGAGFDRVFVTIIDTHVASLIAAAFLFQFGTGPIRGFATTLFFGLLSNVFTAVFVSRTLFEFVLSKKQAGATQLSI